MVWPVMSYYYAPVPPTAHIYTCRECDVKWKDENTPSNCWVCGNPGLKLG